MNREDILLLIFATTSCIDTVISVLRYFKGVVE